MPASSTARTMKCQAYQRRAPPKMSRYPGKAGIAVVPLTLDPTVSPRVAEAVRLVGPVNGRPPTPRSQNELSWQLYGNSAGELADVAGPPWAASDSS